MGSITTCFSSSGRNDDCNELRTLAISWGLRLQSTYSTREDSLVPSVHGLRKERLVSAICACTKIPRNLGNHVILLFFYVWITHNRVILVFLRVMATCSDSDNEFSSALVLRIIYTSEGYSDWKPWRNDCVVIVLLLLRGAAR